MYGKPNVNRHKDEQKNLLNIFLTKFETIQTKLIGITLDKLLSILRHIFCRNEYYLIDSNKWQVGPFLFVSKIGH